MTLDDLKSEKRKAKSLYVTQRCIDWDILIGFQITGGEEYFSSIYPTFFLLSLTKKGFLEMYSGKRPYRVSKQVLNRILNKILKHKKVK